MDIITVGISNTNVPNINVRSYFGNHDDFWVPRIDVYENRKNDNTLAIIGGQWLTIGSVKYPKRGDGFGGRHFRIRFNSGIEIDTCDLWSGGMIPPFWRETIKDNAEFLDIEPGYMHEGNTSDSEE